jgi:hypothetical protein
VDSTGTCNANLPDSSVYARFIYLIRYLARQGFYVIVDNHFNVDTLAADNPGEFCQLCASAGCRSALFASMPCAHAHAGHFAHCGAAIPGCN